MAPVVFLSLHYYYSGMQVHHCYMFHLYITTVHQINTVLAQKQSFYEI